MFIKNEKQVILLMIPNGEIRVAKSEGCEAKSEKRRQRHYLAGKIPLALCRGITSKRHGDFYRLNCLRSFATVKNLESHKKVCENKNFCNVKWLLKTLKY